MQNEDPSEKLFISSSEILYEDESDSNSLAKYSFDEFLSKYWKHIELSIIENDSRKKGKDSRKKSQVNCPALDFKWREKRWQIVRSVVEAAHRSHAPSIAHR